MKNSLFIDTPDNFSFRSTVYSHGWCELAPFELDVENWRLSYVFRDAKNKAVAAVISEEKTRIRIELSNSNADAAGIIADTRHLLRLDDDLTGFYASIAGNKRL